MLPWLNDSLPEEQELRLKQLADIAVAKSGSILTVLRSVLLRINSEVRRFGDEIPPVTIGCTEQQTSASLLWDHKAHYIMVTLNEINTLEWNMRLFEENKEPQEIPGELESVSQTIVVRILYS